MSPHLRRLVVIADEASSPAALDALCDALRDAGVEVTTWRADEALHPLPAGRGLAYLVPWDAVPALFRGRGADARLREVALDQLERHLEGVDLNPGVRTVAELAVHGLTIVEIAEELDLVERTVRRHLREVLDALEVDGTRPGDVLRALFRED